MQYSCTISSVRIELAGGLNDLRLKEHPWMCLFDGRCLLNRLEIPVLLLVLFHFAAHTLKVGVVSSGLSRDRQQ